MSLRAAAQQALEALEDEPNAMVEWKPNHWEYKRVLALTAIRTALAEPEQDEIDLTTVYMAGRMDERKVQRTEQEPVARVAGVQSRDGRILTYIDKHLPLTMPLYTHPPHRKPLTDEEILLDEVLRYHFGCNGGAGPVSQKGIKIIRAVERAHGIGGDA